MESKTRMLKTMNGVLHLWADVDELYVTQGEEGKSWMSVEIAGKVSQIT